MILWILSGLAIFFGSIWFQKAVSTINPFSFFVSIPVIDPSLFLAGKADIILESIKGYQCSGNKRNVS